MHMDESEIKNLHKLNVINCKLLSGLERTAYIADSLQDYKWSVVIGAPREDQRLLRELFSRLVKTVGH